MKEVNTMDKFRITKDQRVFLGEKEIKPCTGFRIIANAGNDPEVELRIIVDSIDIDDYQAIPT